MSLVTRVATASSKLTGLLAIMSLTPHLKCSPISAGVTDLRVSAIYNYLLYQTMRHLSTIENQITSSPKLAELFY